MINWFDSSIVLNKAGTSTDDGSHTAGTKYAATGSVIDTEVSGSTEAADGAEMEGCESHHGNICHAKCNHAKKFSNAKEVPCLSPVLALVPQTVEGEHWCAVPISPRVQ